MPRKKKVIDQDIILEGTENKKTFKCLRCGKEYDVAVGHFYKITYSQLWKANDCYAPICKDCVNEMFDEYSRKFGSDRTACMIMSHVLDVPFYNSLFDSISQNNGRVTMGLILRIIGNARNFQFQTFSNTLVNGDSIKTLSTYKKRKSKSGRRQRFKQRTTVFLLLDTTHLTDITRATAAICLVNSSSILRMVLRTTRLSYHRSFRS